MLIIFTLCICYTSNIFSKNFPQYMAINSPLANVYLDLDYHKIRSSGHNMQTQLVYGERICALKAHGNWLKIAALELPIKGLASDKWEGYRGWINRNHTIKCLAEFKPSIVVDVFWSSAYQEPSKKSPALFVVPFGTMLHGTRFNNDWWQVKLVDGSTGYVLSSTVFEFESLQDSKNIRSRLVKLARIFLESDYCFGGRSPHQQGLFESGVNCSGLTNLLYRACGLQIPLKAHDQYLKAITIDPIQLQAGDLVFVQWDTSTRIRHVLMYLGNEKFIEASTTGAKKVRICDATKRFGKPLHALKNGDTCSSGKKTIFFGSFLINRNIIHELRTNTLTCQETLQIWYKRNKIGLA